jgi:carbamoyltransferase
MKNLSLAGGVALNCVANGKILKKGIFDDIWIQPAAGDSGGALGAALFTWYQYLDNPRIADGKNDFQKGSFLGPDFSNEYIEQFLIKNNFPFQKLTKEEFPVVVADLIAEEKVIGWFEGRMEFGPRALGARSIIGDARSANMQSIMNLKIKFRESFRPFAPSIIEEKVSEYFELDKPSPYMLVVADVKKERQKKMNEAEEKLWGIDKLNIVRSDIPAITHVDYSARIQTVSKNTNLLYHKMISEFDNRHGCAVIINTSFNIRGEPIVCTPHEAYTCFMRTGIDFLVLGNCLLDKKAQKPMEKDINWKKEFELD